MPQARGLTGSYFCVLETMSPLYSRSARQLIFSRIGFVSRARRLCTNQHSPHNLPHVMSDLPRWHTQRYGRCPNSRYLHGQRRGVLDDRWTPVRVRVRVRTLVLWFHCCRVCFVVARRRVRSVAALRDSLRTSTLTILDTRSFCGRHELAQIHWAWPLPHPHPWQLFLTTPAA